MTTPYYQDDYVTLYQGDCKDIIPHLEPIDLIVTDPPYGISFMGKKWDYDVPSVEIWERCLSVIKPGGYLFSFAGTRTQHRMAVRIEDAGFEIRDMIAWVYGSGFPKSMNVSNAMKEEPEAAKWEGWGTALKPALEPITVARKPFGGTVASNVLKYGTGALNIDKCRVGSNPGYRYNANKNGTIFHGEQGARIKQTSDKKGAEFIESTKGRWPANLIHDGSPEVLEIFPEQEGLVGLKRVGGQKSIFNLSPQSEKQSYSGGVRDFGSAARFFQCCPQEQRLFYTAKANKKERGDGNNHPTVKPLKLMEYLINLGMPDSGVLLDPFAGSGSTLVAAKRIGRKAIGIELEPKYCDIIIKRLEEPCVTK
jgi:DNA modification methylase